MHRQNPENLLLFAASNYGDIDDGRTVCTIGSPGIGKNVLTVGATSSGEARFTTTSENGTAADGTNGSADIDTVAYYSSYGPTQDGRIKPEIVAPADMVSVSTKPRQKSRAKGRHIFLRLTTVMVQVWGAFQPCMYETSRYTFLFSYLVRRCRVTALMHGLLLTLSASFRFADILRGQRWCRRAFLQAVCVQRNVHVVSNRGRGIGNGEQLKHAVVVIGPFKASALVCRVKYSLCESSLVSPSLRLGNDFSKAYELLQLWV